MKPLSIFIILLFLQPISIHCQVYQPLGVENATWHIGGYGDYHFMSWAYKINGDTIVDSQQYKKLHYLELEVISPDLTDKEYNVQSTELFALIRDDIPERKVYIKYLTNSLPGAVSTCRDSIQSSTNDEILLFDFDLEVGDTIRHCMMGEGEFENKTAVIKSDTISENYNLNRRAWSFYDYEIYPDYFSGLIEGVGFSSGLFNDYSTFIHLAKGLGLVTYCVGSNIDCGLLSASEEVIQQSELQIYPNPTNDYLTLESSYRFVHARIINISGQVVSSISDWNDLRSIDVSHCSPGIYFIEVQTKDNKISRRRFVKQ